MEINEMSMEQIETRSVELSNLLNDENADLEAISNEVEMLEQRKAQIIADAETRKAMIEEVVDSIAVETIEKEEVRKTMTLEEIRNSKEYVNAYAEYLKGDEKELRALLSENATNGVVPVPELVYNLVKNAWEREGIMARVRKAYMKGNLKVGFEISADGAVIHTEGAAAPTEEKLVLGIVEMVPASIKKWISISDEVMDLRGEAFLNYIYDELTYQIAKKAADELIAKIKACGTVSTNTPSMNVAVGQLQDNPAVDTIAQAIAKLSDQATDPVIIMNKLTWGAFKSAQYAADYPIDVFEGLPVLFNNSLTAYSAATTGVTYAIVGSLAEGALANFPAGEEITIKFDDLSLAEKDLVKVVGREYVALAVIAPDHFVQIKKEA